VYLVGNTDDSNILLIDLADRENENDTETASINIVGLLSKHKSSVSVNNSHQVSVKKQIKKILIHLLL